jgi:sortase A
MRWIMPVSYLGRALLLAGALALAYSAWLFVRALWFQNAASRKLEEQIHRSIAVPSLTHSGNIVGQLKIDRVHLSVMVFEGAGAGILEIGARHIPGTALPGTTGNVGIAAHRDTFFRRLRDIQRDDTITLITPQETYRYLVDHTEIVTPEQVQVLAPTADAELTLVTC